LYIHVSLNGFSVNTNFGGQNFWGKKNFIDKAGQFQKEMAGKT
jgi:hypothetical protein